MLSTLKNLIDKHRQKLLFIIVGFLCYLTVMIQLVLLVDGLGMEINLANALASLVTLFICYYLNSRYVFQGGKHSKTREFSAFILFAGLGYTLNLVLMYALVSIGGMWYILAKTFVVITVAVFNFITRKRLVFQE